MVFSRLYRAEVAVSQLEMVQPHSFFPGLLRIHVWRAILISDTYIPDDVPQSRYGLGDVMICVRCHAVVKRLVLEGCLITVLGDL